MLNEGPALVERLLGTYLRIFLWLHQMVEVQDFWDMRRRLQRFQLPVEKLRRELVRVFSFFVLWMFRQIETYRS